MWLWLFAVSALARPQVALELNAPTGEPLFNAEVDVGSTHRFEHSDGNRDWRVHLTTRFEGGQVEVEGRLIELRGRRAIVRNIQEAALDEHEPGRLDLDWKRLDGSFTLQSRWARALSPSASGPLPGGRARFALAWDDAPLHQHPLSDEASDPRRELPDGRQHPSSQVSPYRLVHTHSSEWVELEPLGPEEPAHCHTSAGPDGSPQRAQHYVRTSDLLPVTTRAVNATFEDGSGYTIAAGVVVLPLGEGLYEAHAGDLRIPVRLTEEDVDTRYRPTSNWKVNESGQALIPEDGVLGELPLGPVRWAGESPPIIQGRSGVRTPRVVLRDRCAEVQLVVPVERIR